MKTASKTSAKTRFEADIVGQMENLRRFALKRTRNSAMADDLVQQTMLLALRNRKRFKMGTNVRAWLFTILKNAHMNEIRKDKRNTEYQDDVLSDAPTSAPAQDTHMELLDTVRAAAALPRFQRETIMVHAFESSSYEETANRCGCTLGTVKSRLSRARSYINEQLQKPSLPPGYDDGKRLLPDLQNLSSSARAA